MQAPSREVSAFERLGFFQRRQLGFTRPVVRQAAIDLIRAGEIRTLSAAADASEGVAWQTDVCEAIATKIVQDNIGAWRELAGTDERDWSEFFAQLMAFIEKLMPFIQMLIQIFGV